MIHSVKNDPEIQVYGPGGNDQVTTFEGFDPTVGGVAVNRHGNRGIEFLLVQTGGAEKEQWGFPQAHITTADIKELHYTDKRELWAGVAVRGLTEQTGIPVLPQELGGLCFGFRDAERRVFFEAFITGNDPRYFIEPRQAGRWVSRDECITKKGNLKKMPQFSPAAREILPQLFPM